jgi:hypothetical protein
MQCATRFCQDEAYWWVTAPTGVTRPACRQCMTELVALGRHRYDGEIGRKGEHKDRWDGWEGNRVT